ncbi:hypothetical protein GDO81_021906 [Engystomops pustulosus]|uniref:Uncharacterized protein n=1 Tax=Engystomops pustulosus TaxID=76066 RepID=A0AAV6ZXF9_ENGPU|nr:hypothetical protein GDO81_021906 [Engystomops pustulosus]
MFYGFKNQGVKWEFSKVHVWGSSLEQSPQFSNKRRYDRLDDQWEAHLYTIVPSNRDNKSSIFKDGGKTCTTVSQFNNLKFCPAQLCGDIEEEEKSFRKWSLKKEL